MVPTAYTRIVAGTPAAFQSGSNFMSSKNIAIHLPDGAVREVPAGTTPLEIANSISPRLAAASVVARVTPLNGAQSGSDGKSAQGSPRKAAPAEAAPAEAAPAEAAPAEAAMYAAED